MFRSTSQKIDDLEARLEKLHQENRDLKQDLEYKKSDEFAEAEIRNKLGLAKEGEKVFVVPKKDDKGLTTNDERTEDQEQNWKKWWNLFFGGWPR